MPGLGLAGWGILVDSVIIPWFGEMEYSSTLLWPAGLD